MLYMLCVLVEKCTYVKTEMKMRGFVARSFHELPNDMTEGSRELLLAFGWLMCRSGLIEMFMDQCCTFLDGAEVVGNLDGLATPVSNCVLANCRYRICIIYLCRVAFHRVVYFLCIDRYLLSLWKMLYFLCRELSILAM